VSGFDEETFRRLYAAHAGAMYLLAVRLTGGEGREAEDVVQEAWLRCAAGRAKFGGRSALRTWLCGIVVNCARERRREVLAVTDFEDVPVAPRDRVDLERAVRELPDGFREVLVLHDVYGYTHDEIATLLGIAAGTSKSQLSRARQRIREVLL